MGKIIQVVDDFQVEGLTRQGWTLIDRYQETFGTTVNHSVPDPNGQCSYSMMSVNSPVQETRTKFVLELDPESSIAQLARDLEKERESVKSYEEERKELRKEREELWSKVERLKEVEIEAQDRAKRQDQAVSELRSSVTKYEEDMGKIREAIGTRQMEEILS